MWFVTVISNVSTNRLQKYRDYKIWFCMAKRQRLKSLKILKPSAQDQHILQILKICFKILNYISEIRFNKQGYILSCFGYFDAEMTLLDLQRYSWMHCLNKYELDIIVYNFENWLFSIVISLKTCLALFIRRKTCRNYQN